MNSTRSPTRGRGAACSRSADQRSSSSSTTSVHALPSGGPPSLAPICSGTGSGSVAVMSPSSKRVALAAAGRAGVPPAMMRRRTEGGGTLEAHVDETARGRRERWWRSVFLVVATVYVSLLLIGLLFQILGGFAQIALIVFMAWLLAFVLSPVVAWITDRTKWPRGVTIGIVYAATL